MGLFSGLGKAQIFGDRKRLPHGFKGVVMITKTWVKRTRKAGDALIVGLRIVESNMTEAPYRPGDDRDWYQGLTDVDVAFPAIKQWAAATFGYDPQEDKQAIESELCAPTGDDGRTELDDLVDNATEHETDNEFIRCLIRVEVERVITEKNKREFFRHTWSPYRRGECVKAG